MARDGMIRATVGYDEQGSLMREAGVEWLRIDVPFPFEGKVGRVSRCFQSFVK